MNFSWVEVAEQEKTSETTFGLLTSWEHVEKDLCYIIGHIECSEWILC